jgi:hypothetical protein
MDNATQLFYFDTARPADHADMIVHNDEPRQPALMRHQLRSSYP